MSAKLRVEADRSKLPEIVGAVIYVRVSTKEQTENLSLPTQLKACEEYCERQDFHVLARFREEGESAKTADRMELQRLLQFCRTTRARSSSSLATVVDLGNALVLGLREDLFARASGVSWLILTFYVPAFWVTTGLVVWQLLTRTASRP
jgi:hypothetical protein